MKPLVSLDRTNKILTFMESLEYGLSTPLPEAENPAQIFDVRHELPRHPEKVWSKRNIDRIKWIVLHQTLTDYRRSTFRGIALYSITPDDKNHLSKEGAPAVPYHYGIDEKGNVYWMNDWNDVTWSVKGYNTSSLNVAVKGNFDGRGHKGVNSLNDMQKKALDKILTDLIHDDRLIAHLEGIKFHSQLGKPACPGIEIEEWIRKHNNFSIYLLE